MASSSKGKSFAVYTKRTWRRKLVAWGMLFCYLTQPVLASAEVVADTKAPPANTPTVQTAPNGVPVVQIAAPTPGGISHNLYQTFNVDPSGLILNNSRTITQTQLAGYITGNPNLANGSARIILNEVTSTNPSYLRGYTEVAGQKAEVILANPNGIYGDGFGFINTSRAVLTTGTPVFGGSGSLDAFRVTGGQVAIQGKGMNAAGVDQVDILSRSAVLNAGLWAKQINVVAGTNQVDHQTLQAHPVSGDTGPVPQVAIDIGQLGGMYANKIYLVGTEKGVGVNSYGTLAAQTGDITITSAGKVLLAGAASAGGNLAIHAEEDVTVQNTLYARENTNISTQGSLENSGVIASYNNTALQARTVNSTGTLGAGLQSDGTVGSNGNLTIHANGTIHAQGQNMAAGNLTIQGAAIDLANSKNQAGGDANLTADSGDIDHSSGTMQVDGSLTMDTHGVIRNDNGTIYAGKLTLNGDAISNRSGTLSQLGQGKTAVTAVNQVDNTAGTINTNGDSVAIEAGSLLNSQGQVQHAGTGTVSLQTTTGDIKNDKGKLATNGQFKFTTNSLDNTQGTIVAKGIDLNAQGALGNDQGTIASSGDAIRIQAQGTVTNEEGSIEASNGLELTAQSLDNQKGRLVSLDAGGMKVTAQDIQNQAGTIGSNGDMNLTAQSLVNISGKVIAQGNVTGEIARHIDNSNGNILGRQRVTLGQAGTDIKNNQQGTISAGTDLTVTANTFDNTQGSLLARQDLTVRAEEMRAGGTALAGQDLNLTVTNGFTHTAGGDLKANRDVNITADSVVNQGSISAVRNMNVQAKAVANTADAKLAGNERLTVTAAGEIVNSGIMTGDTAVMKAKDIDNRGSIFAGNLTVQADTLSNRDTNAVVKAGQSAELHLNTALHNTNGATIYMGNADKTLTINTVTLDNSGVIASGGNTSVEAQRIQSSGTLGAGIQSDGTMGTTGDLVLKAGETVIATGTNLAAGTVAVAAQDINLAGAKTWAGKDINLTAAAGDITNTGGVMQAKEAVTLQAGKTLHNDKDATGNAANIQGSVITIHADAIRNVGSTITQTGTGDTNLTAATTLDNTSGTIVTNGTNLTVKADTVVGKQSKILHAGTGTVTVQTTAGMSNTQGSAIESNGNVTIQGDDLDNNAGRITAGGNLTARAGAFSNTGGMLAANTDVAVTATTINDTGTVNAGQDIQLSATGNITNLAGSNVKANRDLNLTAVNVTNLGSITAAGDLAINAREITNQTHAVLQGGEELSITASGDVTNSGTMEGKNAAVSAKNITNTGSVIGDTVTLTADTISNHDASAVIAATKKMNLYAKTSLENKEDASIYSMGSIHIAGSKEQNDKQEYIDRTHSILNQSATIEADGDIDIYADTLTNKTREYEVGQTVVSEQRYDQKGVYQGEYQRREGTFPHYKLVKEEIYLIPYTYMILSYPHISIKYLSGGKNYADLQNPLVAVLAETVTETTVTAKSSIGKIASGGDIKLRTNIINNDMGWVVANRTMDTVGNLNNTAVGNTRSITQKIFYQTDYMSWGNAGGHDSPKYYIHGEEYGIGLNIEGSGRIGKAYYETKTEQIPGSASSLFGGSQQVIIQGNVNNTTVAAGSVPVDTVNRVGSSNSNPGTDKESNATKQTVAIQPSAGSTAVTTSSVPVNNLQTLLPSSKTPAVTIKQTVEDSKFTVPANGMFTTHQEPSSKYLVETNPRFANYGNFISSDYVLDKLGLNPADTMKRLGDGFYEQKLVREQVTELTGRYYLNEYSSAEEQYKALMDNGAAYAKQFNLQVGVALTAEQMAQLTSDMVWMVEKEINGQKVLVPEVYLSSVGNIEVQPNGAVISAKQVTIQSSDTVTNAGVIKGTEKVDIQAVNISNLGGTIDGGKHTALTAEEDLVNFGGLLKGETIDLTAGNDFKNETVSFTSTLPFKTKTTVGNIASIEAGDSLTIQGNNISLTGGKLNAQKDVALQAKGNIVVDSIQEQDRLAVGKTLEETTHNVISSINAGNNVSLTSTGDTTLKGAKITAANALDVTAGGNINITAVKDETIQDHTVGSSSNWKRTRTDDETVKGTTLQGGKDVTIKTTTKLPDGTNLADSEQRGNITIAGSTVNSENGKVTIAADKDVTLQEVTEKHESLIVTHKKKSGFLSSKTTDTMDHSLINEVVGSTVSGEQINIASGSDLTVKGSNVVGTDEVKLTATDSINLTSAAETGVSEHYSYTKKSGLFSGGGLGFTIGSQSTKTMTNEQTLGQTGSTIGSIKGDISLTAGEHVTSEGTTFASGHDLSITGKDVTLDNTINTYDSQTKFEFKQSGLSVSLTGGIVDLGTSAYKNLERSGQVQDERLKALYDYKAVKDLKKIKDQLSDGLSKKNLKTGVSLNVSIGSTKTTSEQTVHMETVNTSNINAEGEVTIKATAGDVTLQGTKINAQDITLDAAKDINMQSAENKQQTTTNTSSSSWSVGGSIGSGFFGNVSKGSGKENENGTTHTESILEASDTLTLKSGEDTNILGSQVKGETVAADIKGDLNIASRQDTDDYTAKNQSSGLGFTTGLKGGITGSISQGKTDSTYASVTDQAGIYAGDGGFDIHAGKNTDLKGAVIASKAVPSKNKLSTDTLTYSNIQNHAEYDSSSKGYNLDTKGKIPFSPTPSMPVSGDADSTTKSAVATGTIEVRSNSNQDLSTLSRDTTGALNALDKIFDKKTVQEKQELANLFGEVAFNAIGDLAEREYKKAVKADNKEAMAKWSEGGEYKILLHAVAGGIMSDLGGNGFATGAVSAGVNEAAQKELRKITNPGLRLIASSLVGSVAAKVVGGNASVGASVTTSATTHNALAHKIVEQMQIDLANAQTDAEKQAVINRYLGLSNQMPDSVFENGEYPYQSTAEINQTLFNYAIANNLSLPDTVPGTNYIRVVNEAGKIQDIYYGNVVAGPGGYYDNSSGTDVYVGIGYQTGNPNVANNVTTPPTLREVAKESAGDPFRLISSTIANAVLLPDNVEQGNYGEAVGNVLGVAGGVSVIKSAVGSVGKVGQVAEVGSPESVGTVTSQGSGNVVDYAKYKEVLRTTESANPLVDSLKQTGSLPTEFITKAEAEALGWRPGKALNNYAPGKQIGGDVFENTTGILPEATGRVWYEADVGLTNTMSRSKQPGTRLLYSNDGQLYVSYDHYQTVEFIGTWK